MDPVIRTIPEQIDAEATPAYIYIRIDDNVAHVRWRDGDGRVSTDLAVLSTVVANATTEQQTTIKIFLRMIIAEALGVSLADVPEVV